MTRGQAARRTGLAIVVVVLVVAVVAATLAVSLVRRPLPDTSGDLTLSALREPVTVLRDERGVAQLYGSSATDLVAAQGYVDAQDRFFQMDLRRRAATGRLSELVGADGVASDALARTLGWRRVAEAELPTLAPRTRRLLQAYADGVNAWLADNPSPSHQAVEYTVLGLRLPTPERTPEWQAVDSLAWMKVMAWQLRGGGADELVRARLAGRMSLDQINEIYPAYRSGENLPILSEDEWTPATTAGPRQLFGVLPPALTSAAADRALTRASAVVAAPAVTSVLESLVGGGPAVGSNAWVVAGDRTSTGSPLLANDPHLGVGIPGVWTQVGLHCTTVGDACPLDVSGFGMAGFPGVVIGHNSDIAWGLTNVRADVTDYYLERVRGSSYVRDGAEETLAIRTETIEVAGGADVSITVRTTVHGPILSDILDEVADAGAAAPVEGRSTPERYAVSVAWTGLEPSGTADALVDVMTARTFDEFREAARSFDLPSQNLVYADRAGHIGYQTPGKIPVRSSAIPSAPPGFWPAPGWESVYDWSGFVPFEQLPWTLDPPDGLIVTANQEVSASTRPYLASDWDYGYRAQRITDLIGDDREVTPERMLQVQLDTTNAFSATLVRALLEIDLSGQDQAFSKEGQDLLRSWDGTQPVGHDEMSPGGAYYNVVWSTLLRLLFDDEVPSDLRADGGSRWQQAVADLLENPRSTWWDNKQTPAVVETRDEILRQALVDARLELTQELGRDPATWDWGKLHSWTPTHAVLGGEASPAPVRWFVNADTISLPGSATAVNAMGYAAPQGYAVTWAPSMRMLVDLADLDASRWVNQTGASGHPASTHYMDQLTAWQRGESFAWPFTADAVQEATAKELTLTP